MFLNKNRVQLWQLTAARSPPIQQQRVTRINTQQLAKPIVIQHLKKL